MAAGGGDRKLEQDQQTLLPNDILADVLHRVPLRWLAAARCVCRAWRDAIDANGLLAPTCFHSRSPVFLSTSRNISSQNSSPAHPLRPMVVWSAAGSTSCPSVDLEHGGQEFYCKDWTRRRFY
ncbi:hypothetical protein QYE76_000631 [Lolium multiflorum]|uniref:F-box domain-containing protein n=1 Tax=Lolium multiflorum TaxID=4521 RepID=A0AAD8RHY0_LOLMU|nr:hypothetical protein QYE76_000631 [Lolium multiflorum]